MFFVWRHIAQLDKISLLNAECKDFNTFSSQFFGDWFGVFGVWVAVSQQEDNLLGVWTSWPKHILYDVFKLCTGLFHIMYNNIKETFLLLSHCKWLLHPLFSESLSAIQDLSVIVWHKWTLLYDQFGPSPFRSPITSVLISWPNWPRTEIVKAPMTTEFTNFGKPQSDWRTKHSTRSYAEMSQYRSHFICY